MSINETFKTPISDRCDVLVCEGGVAGISAALGTDFTEIDIPQLQKVLQQNGVVLHEKDLSSQL